MRRLLIALAAVAALAGCGSSTSNGFVPNAVTSSPSPLASPSASASPSVSHHHHRLVRVHDPGEITGTIVGPCHARQNGQLPDPHCTPGSIDPTLTAAEICAPNYTTSAYRPPSSQTSRFKYDVAEPAYGMAGLAGELDHLVSLELGGSNDAANLWPEPGAIPNPKDSVENKLHAWVCAGSDAAEQQRRLRAAQHAIAEDWTTAVQKLGA